MPCVLRSSTRGAEQHRQQAEFIAQMLHGVFLPILLLLAIPAVDWGAAARPSAQQRQAEADPISNVVLPRGTLQYQAMQGATNDTLLCYQVDIALRWSGSRFVPFTQRDQAVVVQALYDVLGPLGPVVFTSYKEFYPDPSAPSGIQGDAPGVDIAITFSWVLNKTSTGQVLASPNWSWDEFGALALTYYGGWVTKIITHGNWSGVGFPQVLYADLGPSYVHGNFTLHTLIRMEAVVAINLVDASGPLGPVVDVVGSALEAALTPAIGTLVEVVDYSRPGSTAGAAGLAPGRQWVRMEVTMFRCRQNATVPSPDCETQVLEAVLAQVSQSDDVRQRWQAAGISSVEVAVVRELPPPSPPVNVIETEAAAQQQRWVPWHLDRIDQRVLPLDGEFTANATGSGVHVFIISSGVLGDHEEFGYMDGRAGFRVEAEWGYKGLQPLEDCPDYNIWYGFGTYSASLCCGLKLGPAKNATIHSVRFRDKCVKARGSAQPWSAGALPSALDLVLSKTLRPAVVLIDTWWTPGGSEADLAAIRDRLDLLQAANVTVIAGAGPVPTNVAPCDNLIANHPAVISVAASDSHDQRTFLGPTNSSCIELFAPSGGLGVGLVGASPAGRANYTTIVTRAFGAAAIAAGVAAQYLELHPNATAVEVRHALLEQMATPGVVTGAGPATTARLLFTDLRDDRNDVPAGIGTGTSASMSSSSDSGLGAGVYVGISIAIVAGLALALGGYFIVKRKKGKPRISGASKPDSAGAPDDPGWAVDCKQIEICCRADGSKWLLGEGRYGKVYKALKDGVQVVAVKTMTEVNERFRELFLKEMNMMKYVSRDANITQFFGAVVQDNNIMLIVEFMEGGDLRNALSNNKLQWHCGGREVMLDILRGLHFLHVSGVTHRDIKSKNILLDLHGRAKLSDVGLAQLRRDEATSKPGFVGTLAWAAPEVVMGEECSDKADIYSVGVVLWEIVTQETPQRGALRDLQVPKDCPQEVAEAVKACMQQKPALRPTAKELYSLLQACPPNGDNQGPPAPSTGSMASPALPIDSFEASRSSKSSSATGAGSISSSTDPALLISVDRIQFCTAPDGTRQELGSGSFGKVYKVLLEGVHPLAAKIVEIEHSPAVQPAFVREASLLWRLRHDHVVALSGICISEGQGMLLMELMDGGSLYHRLNVASSTTKQRVFAWHNRGKHVALDIARGLHYLHSFNITHFDLKSANVLLNRQGTIAKVADVGLARVMSCTHHSFASETPSPPGTFAYMAPELMAGTKCTMAVDIYSYGQLLWEICTGEHPVRGQMRALRVPEDCPQAVAELYMRCISIDPELRPTARGLVDALIQLQHADNVAFPGQTSSGVQAAARAGASAESQADAPKVKAVSLEPNLMKSPFEALRQPNVIQRGV